MKAPRKDRGKRLADAKGREAKRVSYAAAVAASGAGKTIMGSAALLAYDPARRAEEADAALTLYRNEKMLVRAFQEFGLDPANPHHWKLLAQYMAEALFGEDGRPLKWAPAEKLKLYAAAQDLIEVDPGGPRKALGRALDRLLAGQYKGETFDALRARFYEGKKLAVRK